METVTFIDLEINPENHRITDGAALREDNSQFHANNPEGLLHFIGQTSYIGGHNILKHDLAYLRPYFENAGRLVPQVIDTLYLSPLLFPTRPYHRLLKDDKIQSDDVNNPLNDCLKARELFLAELEIFNHLAVDLKKIYYHLLGETQEFGAFFRYVGYNPNKEENVTYLILRHFQAKICEQTPINELINQYPIELAYCLALINSNDRYSITPPWVLKNYPVVETLMYRLRNNPCLTGCTYCQQAFDIHRALKQHFHFDTFRTYNGEPLQENAVQAAVEGKSVLAVFPTGGGKSITFQLPAMMSGEQVKGLTVVISPLQSLMKDQVDNLRKHNITEAVTINGLLDPVERAKSVERVADGSASLLYISPESLRSITIERLLLGRNIVRFVIDEAHCFSAWGQDFRVDYLYIGDFIRSLQKKKNLTNSIPISCFTATAKQKVIEDIREYFSQKLGLNLELFRAPGSRTNLQYEVIQRREAEEKYNTLRDLIEQKNCPTIVYVARTRNATRLSENLKKDGFSARAFHGKMDSHEKTLNQNDFISGKVQVMVATSAFGMGVDKKDVGLVVHYEISDSLENYVQEAGRAGRDENITALCYILFDEEDLSKHFILLNQTRLHLKEIQQVWKAIKSLTHFRSNLSQSALEIARRAGWDDNIADIETRVTTAIAALEEAGYLHRGQNMPRIFANSILTRTAQEAIEKINASVRFNDKQREQAARIIKKLISTKSRSHANNEIAESRVDYIADHLGIPRETIIEIITLLREEKILADARDLTAYIANGENSSKPIEIVKTYNQLEVFLASVIDEEEKTYNLKELREQAEEKTGRSITPEKLRILLNFWAEKNWIHRYYRDDACNHVSLRLTHQTRNTFESKVSKRHHLSGFIIAYLFKKNHENSQSSNESILSESGKEENLIEFSELELLEAYHNSSDLFREERVDTYDIEDTLFYLTRIGALQIEGGFLVVYNKLTIHRIERNNQILYKQGDYRKLELHYEQKIQQIHIVGEYARKMIEDHQQALTFVDDYFRLNYPSFLQKYFPGSRKDEIRKRMTPGKYKQLFGELSEAQLRIVNDSTSRHIVVAAGPGSGKTRLLVHKLASLLMMEDVKHEQLLMLTFSRAAATEFALRLRALVGGAIGYVSIKTFHSYCFDLLGRQGSVEKSGSIISDTVTRIRNNEVETSRITKTVLVIDEAQDMTADEFELIVALMEKNEELRVIAVGDDDQNIFSFRGSNSRYMQEFIIRHQAHFYELPMNYRSKSNLVTFANHFVQSIHGRMKTSDILPVQQDKGNICITRHVSTQLLPPLLNDILHTPLTGTTGVLTSRNEEAMYIACLLRDNGLPARLVQTNTGFDLRNLDEMRFFNRMLNLHHDTTFIDDERWEYACQELKKEFSLADSWELCDNIVKRFAESSPRKYRSDWEMFLSESSMEDFYDAQGETIFVSTIHKAKGREFDNVFVVLDGIDILSEEEKRKIYVAITRARTHLSIHLNGHYLDDAAINNHALLQISHTIYSLPEKLSFVLSHEDVWLNFFLFPHQQDFLKGLKSGMPLLPTEKGCKNTEGYEVLKYSQAFREKVKLLRQKGYLPIGAKVNFIVHWKRRDDNMEGKTVLPMVEFGLQAENINTLV